MDIDRKINNLHREINYLLNLKDFIRSRISDPTMPILLIENEYPGAGYIQAFNTYDERNQCIRVYTNKNTKNIKVFVDKR